MSCIGNSRQAETASMPSAEVCQVVVKHPFMFSLCPSVKYILHSSSYFGFYSDPFRRLLVFSLSNQSTPPVLRGAFLRHSAEAVGFRCPWNM